MNFAQHLYIQSNPANVHVDLANNLKDTDQAFLLKVVTSYPLCSKSDVLENGIILFYNNNTLVAWYNSLRGIGHITERSCHIQ
jgi:hypothetical protein